MKTLLLLLLTLPVDLWAQTEPLKPIEIVALPTYNYTRYGPQYGVSQQYTYDGIEVRHARDLAPYIVASGDRNAILEFQQFTRQRSLRTSMLVLGGITTTIGLIIASSPKTAPAAVKYPNVTYYNGLYYGNGVVYGSNPNATSGNEVKQANTGGLITAGVGLVIMSIGALAGNPNFHLRRAIQYYNKALKQQGISWQVAPSAGLTHSGIGLAAQF